jgi:hypothetical protein
MIKMNLSYWALFLLIPFFSGCYRISYNGSDSGKNVTGSGDLVQKTISLADFNKLELSGEATINISKGATQQVKITAQQNILDIMKYSVENNTLNIGFKDNISVDSNKGITIDITTPQAMQNVNINGAGKLNISGDKQESFSTNIMGAGAVDAYNLEVSKFTVNISGAGSCKTKVSDELNVVISGAGSVVYKGNPKVNKTISGIGVVSDGN